MGNSAPIRDADLPEHRGLPCDHATLWKTVSELGTARIKTLDDFEKLLRPYCAKKKMQMRGLKRALQIENFTATFFDRTLPFIIRTALSLPQLRAKLPNGRLPILRQNARDKLVLSRDVVASLVCNMFLCSFDYLYAKELPGNDCMPEPSFVQLFGHEESQEISKLRMMLAYFDRLAREGLPRGFLTIDRVYGVALTKEQWLRSTAKLLPMELAPPRVGFESAPELAHADFANMFLGGGILCGGCVQEEIRFSMCPELLVSMLVCPCMMEGEAIQIVGAERYCSYRGYAFNLEYGGEFKDRVKTLEDGSVENAILAMDAQDFRMSDSSLRAQFEDQHILRDLNKSLAAFTPVCDDSLRRFPIVATGNWGCGAFMGCPQLKAIVQWASASHCGRSLRYFPFDEDFGPVLQKLSDLAVARGVTVGELLTALVTLGRQKELLKNQQTWGQIFSLVAQLLRLVEQTDQAQRPRRASSEVSGGAQPSQPKRNPSEIR